MTRMKRVKDVEVEVEDTICNKMLYKNETMRHIERVSRTE